VRQKIEPGDRDCIYGDDGSCLHGSGNMYDLVARNVTHLGIWDPYQGTSGAQVCFEVWWQYRDEYGNVINEVNTGEKQCYIAHDQY